MFTPPAIAQIEPLLDLDDDLAQLETKAEAGPLAPAEILTLATEYFNRAYMQRALHAAQQLVKAAPNKAASWRLLANCQLDLAQDEPARTSIQKLQGQGDASADDAAWAKARLGEIAARLGGTAPSLAEATFAGMGPADGAAPKAKPEPKPEPKPQPKAMAAAAPQRIDSAIDMLAAPAPPPPPEKAGIAGALERQGIITVVASRDNQQLEEVRKLVEADPTNADLLDWYAFALYTADRLDEAITTYEQLLKTTEPTDKMYYYLGSAYLKKPDIRRAFVYFNELKKRFPTSKMIEKIDEKKLKLAALSKN